MDQNRLESLLDNYRTQGKALTNMLKPRMKDKIPDNCLNEIRALLDHIARCYKAEQEKLGDHNSISNEEIAKAEGHLRRLMLDCFKQLNIIFHDAIFRVEKNRFSTSWLYISKGEFWNTFTTKLIEAIEFVIEAKKNESYKPDYALECYDKALNSYCAIEKLLITHKKDMNKSLVLHWFEFINTWWSWLLITVFFSIIAALITQFIVG